MKQSKETAVFNGISGMVCGTAAAFIGIIMLIRITRISKGYYAADALKNVKKSLERTGSLSRLVSAVYEEKDILPLKLMIDLSEVSAENVKALEKTQKKYDLLIYLNGKPLMVQVFNE